MILYYSGSSAPSQSSNSIKSLGGYISGTQIPNSSIGNLFGQLTLSSILRNRRDTKLIVFKNISSETKVFSIYTELPVDSLYRLKIGVCLPAEDPCGIKYFEQINSSDQLPYTAILQEHEGVGNKIEMGSLSPGKIVGVWITREVLPETVQTYTTMSTDGNVTGCTEESISKLENRLLENKTVEPKIIISWN